jgi:hypothetical protein
MRRLLDLGMQLMGIGEWAAVCIGLLVFGIVLGAFIGRWFGWKEALTTSVPWRLHAHEGSDGSGSEVYARLVAHFQPVQLNQITVAKRQFSMGIRVDLQKALNDFLRKYETLDKLGVKAENDYFGIEFANLANPRTFSVIAAPLQFEEVDVGEVEPVKCLGDTLWLLRDNDLRLAILTAASRGPCEAPRLQVFVATPAVEAGAVEAKRLFEHLETAARTATTYRGKVLSLDYEHSYTGRTTIIRVHQLRTVGRNDVILPQRTLELLDRNVINFVQQRPRLVKKGLPAKKGLLLYGPPGTGKTHTIHYLARSLPGHTTFLVAGEQVAILGEYLGLARLYQPSIVVLEDVDLIGRSRDEADTPWQEAMLNKLLNEMDGLKEDAEILFILTTNRPEALERALASRPGRVDQAIEFPLPDEIGREKLVRLYGRGIHPSEEIIKTIVRRTQGVSGAFIKELMRRSLQFQMERSNDGSLDLADVDRALDELLLTGGSLNLKLLGAAPGSVEAACRTR